MQPIISALVIMIIIRQLLTSLLDTVSDRAVLNVDRFALTRHVSWNTAKILVVIPRGRHLTNTIAASAAAPHDFRLPSTAFSHRSGAVAVRVDTSVCCASPPSSAPSFGRLLAMPQSPAVPTGAACLPVVRASASTFGADEQNQVHADGMR